MRPLHTFCAVAALVLMTSGPVAAQAPLAADSARVQIRQTLRAFYFNLARGDWEALTADILAAKVVAHRAPPAELLLARQESVTCVGPRGPRVDQATIMVTGDWAEVFVPRCRVILAAGDEFRMIHFEERWRFVGIHLYQEPLNLSTGQ